MKREIKSYPLDELGSHNPIVIIEKATRFAEEYGLRKEHKWFIPQMLAELSTWTLVREDGLIDPRATIIEATKNSTWNRGLYALTRIPRGELIFDRITDYKDYGSFVPLLLAAHKKYNDVPYSRWKRGDSVLLAHTTLADAMDFEYPDTFTTEQLLEMRQEGLRVKSGKTEGTIKNPVTTYGINGVFPLREYPQFAKMMLLQTWCAHPANRSKYMILDPSNWDNMPDPLVSDDVPISTKEEEPVKVSPKNLLW